MPSIRHLPIDEQRAAIVHDARAWLGTPYHHEADVLGSGVDCAMILVRLYCDSGLVPMVDPRPYPAQWMMHRSEERYLKWFTDYAHRVEHGGLGDVMLFKYGRTISHSGIIVGDGLMVHAARINNRVELTETQSFLPRLNSVWSVF